MEEKSIPFSIKLLFWITEVSYWLSIAILLIVLALIFRSFIGELPESLNLQVEAPFTFNLAETGSLETNKGTCEVSLIEARGKISFNNTPSYVTRPLAISIGILICIAFFVVFSFRSFVRGIYKQGYFITSHTIHLRNMAFWLTALWLCNNIYFIIFSHLVSPLLTFDGITINQTNRVDGTILFFALFIWAISHLIKSGISIQDEQNLTI